MLDKTVQLYIYKWDYPDRSLYRCDHYHGYTDIETGDYVRELGFSKKWSQVDIITVSLNRILSIAAKDRFYNFLDKIPIKKVKGSVFDLRCHIRWGDNSTYAWLISDGKGFLSSQYLVQEVQKRALERYRAKQKRREYIPGKKRSLGGGRSPYIYRMELQLTCSEEHISFIRGKRSKGVLHRAKWDSYITPWCKYSRSWKQKKIKRQWQKNINQKRK